MTSISEKKRTVFLGAALMVGIPLLLGFVLYRVISSRGHIPEMPRAALEADGAHRSIDALSKRIVGFVPTKAERDIITRLEDLHLAETGAKSDTPPTTSVEKQTRDLMQVLKKTAEADRARFLVLGDFLAFRFHLALEALLKQPVKNRGPHSLPLTRVVLFGGAFYRQALARGLIGANGALQSSEALPEILFRTRWRRLAGMKGDEEFDRYEQTALLDFTVRFVDKSEVSRRLDAARKLGARDSTYDGTVADALIYFEGGDPQSALKLLHRAETDPHSDTRTVQAFIRALEESL